MTDDGYIKYLCNWTNKPISMPKEIFKNLNNWRTKLFDLSLIGVYENGVGFGNLSYKKEGDGIYITGTATGEKRILSSNDYSLVTEWSFEKNSVECSGKLKASSESLSHAAIYETNKKIKAAIHIHSMLLWKKHLKKLPTTSLDVTYGTPEMAYAIHNLQKIQNYPDKGILIMGGHEEGIISYGKNLDEAGNILLNYFTNL